MDPHFLFGVQNQHYILKADRWMCFPTNCSQGSHVGSFFLLVINVSSGFLESSPRQPPIPSFSCQSDFYSCALGCLFRFSEDKKRKKRVEKDVPNGSSVAELLPTVNSLDMKFSYMPSLTAARTEFHFQFTSLDTTK
ncbi:hypothetical protein AVEN_261272-1 [Araneus ventricosus]|uniref:Uncharacterized protein n=1 Tax=Araneus ventricosus TaxID=182803 RepID=A0A4Y2GL73_ARAVE|nr:hypothetical protein AVEN_261272-1 [Araneus ventricosus]